MTAGPAFDELADAVAAALDVPVASLTPDAPLAGVVCGDSLELYRLYLVLDEWLPGFELPEQLALQTATLGDAHHYLVTRLAHQAGGPG